MAKEYKIKLDRKFNDLVETYNELVNYTKHSEDLKLLKKAKNKLEESISRLDEFLKYTKNHQQKITDSHKQATMGIVTINTEPALIIMNKSLNRIITQINSYKMHQENLCGNPVIKEELAWLLKIRSRQRDAITSHFFERASKLIGGPSNLSKVLNDQKNIGLVPEQIVNGRATDAHSILNSIKRLNSKKPRKPIANSKK